MTQMTIEQERVPFLPFILGLIMTMIGWTLYIGIHETEGNGWAHGFFLSVGVVGILTVAMALSERTIITTVKTVKQPKLPLRPKRPF
ncbi:MAG: hypothetical protein J7L61_00785 [Thermoplasmata archaeon]|nr:hypothetical protein [Thermoplasmata archaeon]